MSIYSVILFLWGLSILALIGAIWISNRRHERRLRKMRAEADRKREGAYFEAEVTRARFLP